MAKAILLSILMGGLFLVGCSKNSASDAPSSVDMGTVELIYDTPSRQDVGGGRTCVITASAMGPGTIALVAVLEKSGHNVGRPVRMAPAPLDQPIQLSLGGVQVHLTPHIK